MPLADKFASILCKELNRIAPVGEWYSAGRIHSGREAADLSGKLDGTLVYIEVELRRDEPLSNVAKIWRAIEDDNHTNRVILVHAFSGHFPSSNTHRLNAEFIGKHMQYSSGARYVPLSFKFRPGKGATVTGDYRRRAAISLALEIWDVLQTFREHECAKR